MVYRSCLEVPIGLQGGYSELWGFSLQGLLLRDFIGFRVKGLEDMVRYGGFFEGPVI